MKITVKFLFSTLVAAAAMTSTAFATTIYVDPTLQADGVFNFNSLESAAGLVWEDNSISRVEISGSFEPESKIVFGNVAEKELNVVVDKDKKFDVTNGLGFKVDDGATLTIEEGASFTFVAADLAKLPDSYAFTVIGGDLDIAGTLTVSGSQTRFSRAEDTKISGTANFNDQVCVYGSKITVSGTMNVAQGPTSSAHELVVGYYNGSLIPNPKTDLVVSGKDAKLTVNAPTEKAGAKTVIYKYGDDCVSSLVVNDGATFETDGSVENGGAIVVNGATFKADVVSGTGTFTVGTSIDESGKPVATELQIADLKQDVKANENSDKAIILTGNIGTSKIFRVYGDATLDSFNVNAGYSGEIVSASGQVLVYGNTVIGGNSTMNLNYFQSTGSVLLESGSTINTANINIYDKEKNSDFIVRGNLNACTVILINNYYNSGSGSEVLVDQDGVLNGLTQQGNGRFAIQSGYMTVKGCVNGNWTAGGGEADIGKSGLVAMLTVDGTYAAADNNNGKFVNTGDQKLTIGEDGTVSLINGATFGWNADVVNKGAIIVDGSNMAVATGSIKNTNGGWMYFNDANIAAKKIINNQTIIVGGDTNMVFDHIASTADKESGENYLSRFMVGYAPQGSTGNAYMAEPEEWTNLTFDSSTKAGMTIDTFRATFFNTNLMLKDDLTINILENKTYANSYVNFGGKLSGKYAELDLGGKTMTVNGQLNIGNADIKNGDLVIDATNGKSGVNCVTFATNIYDTDYLGVASGASVTIKEAAGFNIYADRVNIEGSVIAEKVNHLNIGHADSKIAPEGSQVVVSGTGSFVVDSVERMTIHGDSSLSVENGGVVNIGGTLTNNGSINVDGGTLTAVAIVNNGSITLNNATFNVTNLTGTGTLTMLGKSEVKDESGSAGVEVESIVVKTESNAVALSSSVNTIVFGGVQEVTETANTEITTLAANESVVIAWHFDVSGIESGESVTVETTIKTGLNDSEIKIFHKGDEVGAEWTEADVSDVNYDATTGKLSFKANSFSSYAVAVPEPSMFGLFAGLGALLLVGTRRRRR